MGEQSPVSVPAPVPVPAPAPVLADNPAFAPAAENALLGGNNIKNKHKTTRRKKHSYFTKDDFINF
jgi:hypothetical protein